MTSAEYYQRASHDRAFRHAQLDDLRYLKFVGAGLIWFCGVVGAVATLYAGFSAGRWDAGFGMFLLAALSGGMQATCEAKIAALEAIERAAVPFSAPA